MSWPIVELGDLAEFRNGINYNQSNFGSGIKVIGVVNFQNYTKPRYNELEEVNPEGVVKEEDILQHNDILFVRSNGNKDLIGRSLFIEYPPEPVTFSGFCIRTRFFSNQAFPRFFAYIFRSDIIRKTLSAYGGGTNIANLNQKILSRLKVPLPPLETQQRIGEILSKYDNLIDNNNRRIALLEESIHLLYKDWFVRLRFPGYESVKVVDGIPDGWEKLPIENLLKFHIGGGWGNEDSDEKYSEPGFVIRGTDIPDIAAGNLTNVPFRFHQESNIRSRYLQDGDIVFEVSGGSKNKGVGRTIIITEKLLKEFNNPVICASFCKLLRPKERDTSEYLWCLLFYEREIGGLTQYESQSASNIINFKFKEFISNREVLLPNNRIIQQFNEYVRPRFQQIRNLASQNHRLKQARDLLLPRLMNGSITP